MSSNFAKKSTSSDLNDIRGRWDVHDDMNFKVIRGQGQGQEMTSVPFRDYFSFSLPLMVCESCFSQELTAHFAMHYYWWLATREGCNVFWLICLFVCLSASRSQKPLGWTLPCWQQLCSVSVIISYVLPVLWMASCSYITSFYSTWYVFLSGEKIA